MDKTCPQCQKFLTNTFVLFSESPIKGQWICVEYQYLVIVLWCIFVTWRIKVDTNISSKKLEISLFTYDIDWPHKLTIPFQVFAKKSDLKLQPSIMNQHASTNIGKQDFERVLKPPKQIEEYWCQIWTLWSKILGFQCFLLWFHFGSIFGVINARHLCLPSGFHL